MSRSKKLATPKQIAAMIKESFSRKRYEDMMQEYYLGGAWFLSQCLAMEELCAKAKQRTEKTT